jgi:hypothetical protein
MSSGRLPPSTIRSPLGVLRRQHVVLVELGEEEAKVGDHRLDGAVQRFDRALHPLEEDGAHDADEGAVPLLELLLAGVVAADLYAVGLEVVNGEAERFDGGDDVAVDVAVERFETVVDGARDLVVREAHRLAVQLHRLPGVLEAPDVVSRPPDQRQQHRVEQPGPALPLLDRAEDRAQVRDGPPAGVPGVVAARDQGKLVVEVPG